jgi:hypothetical protein
LLPTRDPVVGVYKGWRAIMLDIYIYIIFMYIYIYI